MSTHWQPLPKRYERRGQSLPFAGCHAIKCPPGWETACRPLTELGEAYGGWTALVEHNPELPPEGYRLHVDNARITVQASSPRAAFYAFQTLLQAWDGQSLPLFQVGDEPDLARRGVVEGFYGTPWSHQARLRMFDFMGQVKMNLYLYAPKDDPYHREAWREPYPPEESNRLQELIERAQANFVQFGFCISPGLSMVYSDPHEFELLTAKIAAVMQMGVRCFGLLVDDIPETLQHEADKAVYSSLAHAHADLANRLHEWLKMKAPDTWLILCPTFYHNLGEPPYVRELGERTQEEISILWTGRKVVSRSITADEARQFGAAIRRKPLLWDNYPVNDYEPSKLLLGPITGRDAELLSALEGVVANPMNQAEASKIALGTFADYLWNAHDYDPERSWHIALRRLVGGSSVEPFWQFCQENLWTRHWTNGPPAVAKAIEDWQTTGDPEILQTELERLLALPEKVRRQVKNVVLLEDIEPWLSKMEAIADLALTVLERASAGDLDPEWLAEALEEHKQNDAMVCNGWLERWLQEVSEA